MTKLWYRTSYFKAKSFISANFIMMRDIFCIVTLVILLSFGGGSDAVKKEKDDKLGASVTRFSIDLLKKLHESEPNENLLVSPSSIFRILMLTYFGSAGKTSSLLDQVLQLKLGYEGVVDLYNKWKKSSVNGVTESDKLYFDNDFPLKENIKSLLSDELSEIDLKNVSAVNIINEWVTSESGGKINNFLDTIAPNTRMLLMSVINMQKPWKVRFDPEQAVDKLFNMQDGTNKTISFMYKEEKTHYIWDNDNECDILSIPYDGDELSFVIIVPEKGKMFSEIIKSLDYEKLKHNLDRMTNLTKYIYLPKFTVNKDLDLKPVLVSFGLSDLFNRSAANFDKFTDAKGLFMGKVSQKSVLTVNEEGTAAAAASTATFTFMSAPSPVTADRPFIYMVYNNNTKMPLFIGTMMDPEK